MYISPDPPTLSKVPLHVDFILPFQEVSVYVCVKEVGGNGRRM